MERRKTAFLCRFPIRERRFPADISGQSGAVFPFFNGKAVRHTGFYRPLRFSNRHPRIRRVRKRFPVPLPCRHERRSGWPFPCAGPLPLRKPGRFSVPTAGLVSGVKSASVSQALSALSVLHWTS